MKSNQQASYSRLLFWLTVFLATFATLQTALVALVLANADTISLKRCSIDQQNYYEIHQHHSGRVRFEFHYTLNNESYSGEMLAIAHQTNDSRLGYYKMPLGHHDGKYELHVWNKLPANAIPSLTEHSPYFLSQLLWIVTLFIFFLYWLTRVTTRKALSQPD